MRARRGADQRRALPYLARFEQIDGRAVSVDVACPWGAVSLRVTSRDVRDVS